VLRLFGIAVLAALCALVAVAAATRPQRSTASGPLRVAAAENVWGSVAAQLGGPHVRVTSVIARGAVDPHDYEPTSRDARALAAARLVIVNGAGYDPWASRLVAANPVRGRIVLDAGKLAGVGTGGNPHVWYSPRDVARLVSAIAAAYAKLDPARAHDYARRAGRFEQVQLAPYRRAIASIRTRFRGAPVGASESVVAPLTAALGLRLVTPPSFLKAVAEGTEPAAADETTIARQLARHEVAVWIVNVQNATPDVSRLTGVARRHGVPVVGVTETLTPATASFQSWQTQQLHALAAALRKGAAP
jgi:zinc/manganese transport system substrate-binding protein